MIINIKKYLKKVMVYKVINILNHRIEDYKKVYDEMNKRAMDIS